MLPLLLMYHVLAVGSAASVSKPHVICRLGQEHWCTWPAMAEVCGLTDWCVNNEWNHPQNQQSQQVCDSCRAVVSTVRQMDRSPQVQAAIKSELHLLCANLQSPLNQLCAAIEDQLLEYVLQLLATEMEPDVICEELKLCNISEYKPKNPVIVSSLKSGELCSLCQFVLDTLYQNLGTNATETEIEAALDQVCQKLPAAITGQCVAFVQQYLPYVVQLVIQELPPAQICQTLGLCGNSTQHFEPKKPVIAPKMKSGELCSLCQFVLDTLYQNLGTNATETEIEAALEQVCQKLPAAITDQCDTFVRMYLPYVVQLVIQKLPPGQICQKMGFCDNSTQHFVLSETAKRVPHMLITTPSPSMGVYCSACKFTLYAVQSAMASLFWQDETKAAMSVFCTYLATGQSECQGLVNSNFVSIINHFQDFYFPIDFCQNIHLCEAPVGQKPPPPRKTDVLPRVKAEVLPRVMAQVLPTVKAGELCQLCLYVFQILDVILPENATETRIEEALDEVCKYLPTEKEKCDNFVALYTPFVINLVVQDLTPTQICTFLGLCVKMSRDVPKSLKYVPETQLMTTSAPSLNVYCSACKFPLYALQSAMVNSFWKDTTKAAMLQFCTYMTTGQPDCQKLVNSNFAHIISQVVAFRFPIEFCQKIDLCEPPA